jgi:putative ubiquitin-RnfH superfamily antitoxin RatB of RatAB toxin-antitoxin module
VVYATPEATQSREVTLAPGASIGQAIEASGLGEALGIDFSAYRVGVYGQLRDRAQPAEDADRIEIYRPLTVLPNEARLRRVAKKARRS